MRTPLIDCDKCEGKGKVEMSPEMVATLAALKFSPGRTAAELLQILEHHVSVNAINNRLEDLRRMGFAERERHGKFWKYYRKAAQQIIR